MAEKKDAGKVISGDEAAILQDWLKAQAADTSRRDLLGDAELADQSRNFLSLLTRALSQGGDTHLQGAHWDDLKAALTALSKSRATSGFTSSETATFVFSLKEALFASLSRAYGDDPKRLAKETWSISVLLDKLGMLTVDAFQQGREQVIQRQQQELLELSTPVIRLWDGIVAVPLIGTLDSERTQVVMESLLESIVQNEATIAIIDITGVPTVDTLVAQHLLKTISAARLMGAECILSGIRPQIAQTIVHLGVDLGGVGTKSTLADALQLALRKRSLAVVARAAVAPAGA